MPALILGRVVEPPEVLRGSDGVERQLVDPADPMVAPITKGDRVFGWEGDSRYALYVNSKAGAWELWRHEDDGVMRISLAVPSWQVDTASLIPFLVVWLVEHDGRRGYDPVLAALADNARVDKAKAAAADAHAEEAADRLHHGLMRDVGHLEAGMSRRQWGRESQPIPAVSEPAATAATTKE
jgi:hypothetical protein